MKLICRSKAMLIITCLGMILTVGAVASGFHTLLDSASRSEEIRLGYEMQEGSSYSFLEGTWESELEKEKIIAQKFTGADPESVVKSGDADVFVNFTKDGFYVTGSSKKELETRIVKYILFQMEQTMLAMKADPAAQIKIDASSLPTKKVSEAENYYGIAQPVYFITICSIFLTMIYWTERKNRLLIRYRIGKNGAVSSYFGKLISGSLISFLVLGCIGFGLVNMVFDVHIGNPVITMGVLFLMTIAFTAFGMLFFQLFKQMAVSIGLMFMVLWFAGYFGGSFETYMYSSFSESLKRLSPVYYINRSLIELSVEGQTDFILPCILYLSTIALVSIALGVFITAKKKEV